MDKKRLDSMNPKTNKVFYELEEDYRDKDYEFIPENQKRGMFFGELSDTGRFLLGRVRHNKSSEEYQLRVDITDKDSIDIDLMKPGRKKPIKKFPGHKTKKSEEDPHDFHVAIPDDENPIFKGTIRVKLKGIVGGFREVLRMKDNVKIFTRKVGEKDWQLRHDSNQSKKQTN